MTDNSLKTKFLSKLHDLLEEYNVSIEADYDYDEVGVNDTSISILHTPNKRRPSQQEEWCRLKYQMCLNADNLEQ